MKAQGVMSDFEAALDARIWEANRQRQRQLTHAAVLTEDFDEIESVETQQKDQLVLTFSVVAGSL